MLFRSDNSERNRHRRCVTIFLYCPRNTFLVKFQLFGNMVIDERIGLMEYIVVHLLNVFTRCSHQAFDVFGHFHDDKIENVSSVHIALFV